MRPPHEIKRGQRGAKPGVPRKSRSTDEEAEELEEKVMMEMGESEQSDDDAGNRLPSTDYSNSSPSPNTVFFPKQEAMTDADHAIDLVRHQRHPSMFSSPDLTITSAADNSFLLPNNEALMSQLSATRTNQSLASVIKSEADWATATGISKRKLPHMPGE